MAETTIPHDEVIPDPVVFELEALRAAPPGLGLAQACDVLARRYPEGAQPQVRIDTLAPDLPARVLADRYWHMRVKADPRILTAADCGGWISEHVDPDLQREIREQWGLGHGFVCADHVESLAEITTAARDLPKRAEGGVQALLFHAGKLRANMSFAALHDLLSEHSVLAAAAGCYLDSAVVHALRAFAAFGDRRYTSIYAVAEYETAWGAVDRGRAAVDVALNGLRLARPFLGQGPRLVEDAREAVRVYPGDHAMYYHLAVGHTVTGEWEAALNAIDEALALLPAHGWRGSHGLLTAQYTGQRLDILRALARQLDG